MALTKRAVESGVQIREARDKRECFCRREEVCELKMKTTWRDTMGENIRNPAQGEGGGRKRSSRLDYTNQLS